jgi:hypothetical protein
MHAKDPRFPTHVVALLAGSLLMSACGEGPTDTYLGDIQPAYAGIGGGSTQVAVCPGNPDVVVTDQDELFAALSSAGAGDVIGIDGMIEMSEPALIDHDGVTLTCATPSSGLFVTEGNSNVGLVDITASDVTLSRLVIDASEGRRAIRGLNFGTDIAAHATKISHNEVLCGWSSCVFLNGVAGVEIRANLIVAPGPVRLGVHIQGHGPFAADGGRPRMIDGARIEGNVIVAQDESSHQAFGGIRARDGVDVSISHNDVLGRWQNSMSLDDLKDSHIKENSFVDPIQYGIVMGLSSPFVAGVRGNLLHNNSVTGAGEIGVWMVSGCSNSLRSNVLVNNGTDGIDGIRFSDETGNNTYLGDLGVIDADGSDYDCDGDGVLDPNILRGTNR